MTTPARVRTPFEAPAGTGTECLRSADSAAVAAIFSVHNGLMIGYTSIPKDVRGADAAVRA
jgi:hypothetical protein